MSVEESTSSSKELSSSEDMSIEEDHPASTERIPSRLRVHFADENLNFTIFVSDIARHPLSLLASVLRTAGRTRDCTIEGDYYVYSTSYTPRFFNEVKTFYCTGALDYPDNEDKRRLFISVMNHWGILPPNSDMLFESLRPCASCLWQVTSLSILKGPNSKTFYIFLRDEKKEMKWKSLWRYSGGSYKPATVRNEKNGELYIGLGCAKGPDKMLKGIAIEQDRVIFFAVRYSQLCVDRYKKDNNRRGPYYSTSISDFAYELRFELLESLLESNNLPHKLDEEPLFWSTMAKIQERIQP